MGRLKNLFLSVSLLSIVNASCNFKNNVVNDINILNVESYKNTFISQELETSKTFTPTYTIQSQDGKKFESDSFDMDIISKTLSEYENFEDFCYVKKDDNTYVIFEAKKEQKIPVLLFHDISENGKFSLSPNNLEYLLNTLNVYNFYPISDLQLLNSDFSNVPSGKKIYLLNSDDAPNGAFLINDDNTISNDSMVSILERYLPRENGKINCTFFISFDRIPFGQYSKLNFKFEYLENNFYIGNHTYNHKFTLDLSPEEFIFELNLADKEFQKYLEAPNDIISLAYPYGVKKVPNGFIAALDEYYGKKILAYDATGGFSDSPFSENFNRFDVSRLTVKEDTLDEIINALSNKNIYTSRRIILYLDNYNNLEINLSDSDIIYNVHEN